MIDLDGYFARIGYGGPREATLGVLRAIHRLHPAAIPFENLDPLLRRPVRLDLNSLQSKLVGQRRGGYCFEQNTLLQAVLEALGFRVTPLAARVVWMGPPGPRTHMLLQVDLAEGPHIADVGFGGHLAAGPLRLAMEEEQAIPGSVLRYRREGDWITLQVGLPAGWRDAYRFTLEPHLPVDFEMGNWFTSTLPGSLFLCNLLAERVTAEVRATVFNRRLIRRFADGRVEEAAMASPADLAGALEELGLEAPVDAAEVFARLPEG